MIRKFYILILIINYCIVGAQICPKDPTPIELIPNGAFELTNSAANGLYASDYPGPQTNVTPDSWGIGKDPSDLDGDFASLKDHTTGNGNMMVIDADGTLGKDAYRTTVNVTANTTYFFSAWFVNVNKNFTNTPQLRFSINNQPIGNTVTVSNSTREWQQFYVVWFSGATSGTNIPVRIENMITTSTGNDLAIDDISFSSSCTKIQNLSKYGKNSILPDSLFVCETTLPIVLNTQITTSSHNFTWKTTPNTSEVFTSTYSISAIPSYNKLYICYDSLADGITCPKLDSVVIIKNLRVKLGPDRNVCEPISENLVAAPNTTGADYTWTRNTSALANTTTTLNTTQEGLYKITATKPGCGAASDELTIAKIPAPMASSGLYCNTTNPEEGFFTLNNASRINNALNIKWYNQPSGGTEISSTKLNDSTIQVTSAVYASIPNCARAMWAEDVNAFETIVTQPLNPSEEVKKTSTDIRQRIIVRASSLTIDSISFYIDNNSSSTGTTPYEIMVFSSANLITPLYTSAVYNYTKVSDPTPKTIPLGVTLQGNTAGVSYWILINGEIAYYNNDPSYPYNNSGTSTVLSIVESYREGQTRPLEMGYISQLKATVGNVSKCERVLVCADVLNCTLPIQYLYINTHQTDNETHLTWAVAQSTQVRDYVVEYSNDGIKFQHFTNTGKNTFALIPRSLYSERKKVYVRIKTTDTKGKFQYSSIRTIYTLQNIEVYPNPSTEDFHVRSELEGSYVMTTIEGSMVEEGTFENNFTTQSKLNPGVYLLKIKTLESNYTLKIIKR